MAAAKKNDQGNEGEQKASGKTKEQQAAEKARRDAVRASLDAAPRNLTRERLEGQLVDRYQMAPPLGLGMSEEQAKRAAKEQAHKMVQDG